MIHEKTLEFWTKKFEERYSEKGIPREYQKYGFSPRIAAEQEVYKRFIRYNNNTHLYHNFKIEAKKSGNPIETRTISATRYYDGKKRVEYIQANQKLICHDKLGNQFSVFLNKNFVWEEPIFARVYDPQGGVSEDWNNIVRTEKHYLMEWNPKNLKELQSTYFFDDNLSHTSWDIISHTDGIRWSCSQEDFEKTPREELIQKLSTYARKQVNA